MVSFTSYTAAAVLAFSGLATAIPAYTYSNGTTYNTTSSSSVSGSSSRTTSRLAGTTGTSLTPATDYQYCNRLNGNTVTLGSKTYYIECGKTHFGTQISISVGIAKRAVYESLGDCINLCSATTTCVGTAFDLAARSCTLYSDVQAAVDATGIDFAILVANNAVVTTTVPSGTTTVPSSTATVIVGGAAGTTGAAGAGVTSVAAGGVVTIPVYSTTVKTILSCAPTVTNCPLRNNGGSAVVTQLVVVSSTLYTCPAATTLPATPIACSSCPYTAVTATQYSATSSAGTTSFVAVATNVVNYPMATGTQVTVTVCTKCVASTATGATGSGSGSSAVTSGATGSGSKVTSTITASKSSSTMAVYTGAAGQVKAGMGFAAFVAGAAVLL